MTAPERAHDFAPERRPGDPVGYETQRRILAGLSAAGRRWQLETGARLEVLNEAPYFHYSRGHLPKVPRTGETISEKPIRNEAGRVVARRLIRECPDGTTSETVYPIEEVAS